MCIEKFYIHVLSMCPRIRECPLPLYLVCMCVCILAKAPLRQCLTLLQDLVSGLADETQIQADALLCPLSLSRLHHLPLLHLPPPCRHARSTHRVLPLSISLHADTGQVKQYLNVYIIVYGLTYTKLWIVC